MSDNQFDDDLFDDDTFDDEPAPGQNAPKGLREYAKRQKQENQQLRQEFEEFKKTTREKELNRFVESKGLDPAVKEMIGDADPDEWFTKFGHVVGGGAKRADDDNAGDDGDQQDSGGGHAPLTPEQKAALQGVTGVQPGRTPVRTGGVDLSELDGAASLDDALAILAKQGLVAPEKSQY